MIKRAHQFAGPEKESICQGEGRTALAFRGTIYIHVCKMETLREAYQMARSNGGAPYHQ
jgi:hypothetical protein